jgi:hypothetical protein
MIHLKFINLFLFKIDQRNQYSRWKHCRQRQDQGSQYRAYIKYATVHSRSGFENWDQVEQRLPGQYNVRQLFWLGAANVWCQKSRPESLKLHILTGAHSPSRFRVRGPFANMPQFASDYNCPLEQCNESSTKMRRLVKHLHFFLNKKVNASSRSFFKNHVIHDIWNFDNFFFN